MTARAWLGVQVGVGCLAAACVGWLMAPGIADGRFDNGHIVFGLGIAAGGGATAAWAAQRGCRWLATRPFVTHPRNVVHGALLGLIAAAFVFLALTVSGADPVWPPAFGFLTFLSVGLRMATVFHRTDEARRELLDSRVGYDDDPVALFDLSPFADQIRVGERP